MSNIPKRLYKGTCDTTSIELYKVKTGKTILKNIVLCNTDADKKWIMLHIVSEGESVGNNTKFLSDFIVEGNDTVVIELSAILEIGDSIVAYQEKAKAINIHVSGLEVT
ncbi:hypothetical protein M5X17_27515 [Paenibacillus alvei]|uniref:hypothetical protein n=1 Tax=Paenibacillus alvei TaxID=44250 RepID=UPI00228062E9|nr:hypothetical protein [Paenibacillus alvei]MCY9737454.1 hypothetical protein [Paenibacillus alvei]